MSAMSIELLQKRQGEKAQIGQVTTHLDGTKWRKQADGKWVKLVGEEHGAAVKKEKVELTAREKALPTMFRDRGKRWTQKHVDALKTWMNAGCGTLRRALKLDQAARRSIGISDTIRRYGELLEELSMPLPEIKKLYRGTTNKEWATAPIGTQVSVGLVSFSKSVKSAKRFAKGGYVLRLVPESKQFHGIDVDRLLKEHTRYREGLMSLEINYAKEREVIVKERHLEIVSKTDPKDDPKGITYIDVRLSSGVEKSVNDMIQSLDDDLGTPLHRSGTIKKSKTFSGYKLQGRIKFQGLPISIENERGTMRRGEDKDGHEWASFMHIPYGYIRLTEGTDGDHVDCYLGPDSFSVDVFVVHQNDPVTGKYDEDKVMLGFGGYAEARRAYMRQYDRPGFFGSMDHCQMDEFKELLDKREGVKLKKSLEKAKYLRRWRGPDGKWRYEYLAGHEGRKGSDLISKTEVMTIPSLPDYTIEKNLGGTTGGAYLIRTHNGEHKVMKRSTGSEHLLDEYTANIVYDILGVPVPKVSLHMDSQSRLTQLADYKQGTDLQDLQGEEREKAIESLQRGFVADALLANWDVLGLDEDNILWDGNVAWRIDNGGSLRYRAQGAGKGTNFARKVGEIATMRDPNRQAGQIFGSIKQEEIDRQIASVRQNKEKILSAIRNSEVRGIMVDRIDSLRMSKSRTVGGISEGTLIKSLAFEKWYTVVGNQWTEFHVYTAGISLLEKAVKIKTYYSPEEVRARGMRWVTIRGARLLLQGTSDGGWVVVGGAGGKLNHMRVDQILSKEEYAEKRETMKEQAKKELRALSKEELAEQREKRKVEVTAKKEVRAGYEEQVRGIMGVTEESLRSQITGRMMDEITDRARKIIETRKRKVLDVGDERDIEKEKEKIVQQEVKKTIKDTERRALDVLMNDYEGVADPNAVKKELRGLLDKEKAVEILRARKEFKKAVKKIGTIPFEPKQPRLKIGQTFAATSSTTNDEIMKDVKDQLETAKNIALYDKMNAQSQSVQKYVSQGNSSTVNGIISDVFGGGAVFGPSAFDELGVEAVARAVAVHIQQSGKAKEVRAALEKFSQDKREKIVTNALNNADERFQTADDLRSLARGDEDDAEGLMSMAQANGYALKEMVAAQQELGSAVGSLQAMAHVLNALEDPPADAVILDVGTDLYRARQRAKRAGLKRGDYKIRIQKKGRGKRLILEIPKESVGAFIQSSQDMQQADGVLDRIKMHKENVGYKPPGIKESITLKPSQEAGLHFFKERKNVLLDFEAGLGKTAVGYGAAMEAMNNMGAKKVLVITPAKLRNQFKDDAGVFLDPEYQKLVKNTGTMKDRKTRLAAYQREKGIDIVGHDTLVNDAEALAAAGYDMVVIDEIHEMTPQGMGKGSQRYQGMLKLRDIPMKIGMSGTNIKNSKTELYRKIDFLDPNHSLGSMDEFEKKYRGLNQGTSAFQESSNDAFRKATAPYMYTQKNNLDVTLNHTKERVPLTKYQRERMREIMRTYAEAKAAKVIGAAGKRDADLYRVVQNDAFAHSSKAGRIVETMKNKHPGEKALIHVQGIQALESTKQRLEAEFGQGTVAVIKGEGPESGVNAIKKAKKEFNNPSSPVRFIIGTKSMEAGHNLQGATVVFNQDLPDTYASVDQRIKRAYREGQDRNVTAYTLSGVNPLDLRQEDLIRKKKKEMAIIGNPQAIEGFDGTGFLAYLNAAEREAGIGKQVAAAV